jgi:tRNA pseudouridine65 synthase
VVLFALDAQTARNVQKQFESGNVVKRYIALVRGPMTEGCLVEHPIPQRGMEERVHAITQFRPLAHSGRWSLVEARPLTGRTHQIRLHLKHLSHHIVGDVRYGKGDVNRHFREHFDFRRLALHAFALDLDDANGRRVEIRADLPEDFSQLLGALGMLWAAQN